MIQNLSNTPVANTAASVSIGPRTEKQKANAKQQHFKVSEPDLPGFEFTARWIENAAELEELVDPWNRLSETALHSNPFFDADFLIPAMNTISGEGDFQRVLTDVLRKRNATLFHRDAFTRACFLPAENAATYINAKVSTSTRKNTQRLERKLNGIGDVAISLSQPFDDHRQWSEEFIALEASGWKGEMNTSFGSNPNQRRFFEELTRRSLPTGRMSFLKVTLDSRPIAMLCDLHSSNVAAHFKTTFAESHAEYSPGLIAELHNIHRLHDSNVTRMDSCADPDHSMINRVWPDRLRMESIVVALGGMCSQLATAAMPTIQILGKTFIRGENK